MCKLCLRVAIGRPWSRSLSVLEEPQAGEESDEKAVEVPPGQWSPEEDLTVMRCKRAIEGL